jgi:hypothetical protein
LLVRIRGRNTHILWRDGKAVIDTSVDGGLGLDIAKNRSKAINAIMVKGFTGGAQDIGIITVNVDLGCLQAGLNRSADVHTRYPFLAVGGRNILAILPNRNFLSFSLTTGNEAGDKDR